MNKNFLESLEGLKKTTPVIVCGAARSGTRMMTDILNTHKNILIQEEMHANTIESYFNMLRNIDDVFDSYSERKGYQLDTHWNNSKHILSHVFFATAGKKKTTNNTKEITFHGIKTPGYERYFPELEDAFSHTPPIYIYIV